MADRPEALRVLLNSVRASLETARLNAGARQAFDPLEIKQLLLGIEAARLALGAMAITRGSITYAAAVPRLYEFMDEITKLLSDARLQPLIKGLRFTFHGDDKAAATFREVIPNFRAQHTIELALNSLLSIAASIVAGAPTKEMHLDLLDLKSVIPEQKIAPAQFDIEGDKLVVVISPSKAEDEDLPNIEAARAELFQTGESIVKELHQTNCDRRLVAAIKNVQIQLSGAVNAIRLGLANMQSEALLEEFQQELPAAISGMLKGHIRGIYLLLRQYQEWNRFSDNAVLAHIENADISALSSATKKFVAELERKPELIDPEVPKVILYLDEMLQNPRQSSKRGAFALIRTIQNLVSRIYKHCIDALEQTAKKTAVLTSAVLATVAAAWLSVALLGADTLRPLIKQIPELSWLRTVTEGLAKRATDEITH